MPVKKITKPNAKVVNDNFSLENFVKNCSENKYILVVGNEAILKKKDNEDIKFANGDSLKLLFKLTIDHLANNGIIVNNINDFTQLDNRIHHLRTKVLETIDGLDFDENFNKEIEPSLLELLKTKCFRLVLTTAIDPYLEIAMEKVWGKGNFRVMDFYGDVKDLPWDEQNFNEFNEFTPTLYYVFGKADVNKKEKKFVLTENDAMRAIERWFAKDGLQNLLKYIHDDKNYIVSIGCKFDNWLFRFFWYILIGNVKRLSSRGQVAIELTDDDKKLSNYLKNQHIQSFTNARDFMNDVIKKMKEYKITGTVGGIFISYANEDKYIALPLYHRLKERYNVWMDERLEAADGYDIRIQNAINSCTVFMPILSSQVKSDLKANKQRYYRQEWQWAQDHYDAQRNANAPNMMKFIPILIGSYDIRGDYHQRVPECLKVVTAFNLREKSIDELFEILNRIKL